LKGPNGRTHAFQPKKAFGLIIAFVNLETGIRKLEIGNWKMETGNRKQEIGKGIMEKGNREIGN